MLKLGLDIDGVLAKFYETYYEFFNMPKDTILDPYKLGRACDDILIHEKDFWVNMPVYKRPVGIYPTVICTKRNLPVNWTKEFLKRNHLPQVPIIQIAFSDNKAKYLKGKVDVFVDDSPENLEDLLKENIPCLLMDTPWNKHYNTPYRIYSLHKEEIERVYNHYFKSNKYAVR